MSDNTFTVYIDESGSEGSKVGQGASEFLAVSCIIIRKTNLAHLAKIYADSRNELDKKSDWKFKTFKDLNSDGQKWVICRNIAKSPVRGATIILHKPSFKCDTWHDNHGELYFYANKLLIERISWICRDNYTPSKDSGNGTAEIIFSERKSIQYERFVDYLNKIKGTDTTNTEWAYIDTNLVTKVEATDAQHQEGLLTADYLASSVGRAIEYKEHGVFDDRFVRLFRPVIYNHNGKYLSYGFKIWPSEATQLTFSDERFRWFRESFKS